MQQSIRSGEVDTVNENIKGAPKIRNNFLALLKCFFIGLFFNAPLISSLFQLYDSKSCSSYPLCGTKELIPKKKQRR